MLSACGFWLFRRGSMSWCSQVSRSLLWLLSRFVFVLISLFYLSFSKGLIYFSWVAWVGAKCMFLPRFEYVAKFNLWFLYSPQKGPWNIFEWQFLINRCKMYSSLTAVIAIEFLNNFWHKMFGELECYANVAPDHFATSHGLILQLGFCQQQITKFEKERIRSRKGCMSFCPKV